MKLADETKGVASDGVTWRVPRIDGSDSRIEGEDERLRKDSREEGEIFGGGGDGAGSDMIAVRDLWHTRGQCSKWYAVRGGLLGPLRRR